MENASKPEDPDLANLRSWATGDSSQAARPSTSTTTSTSTSATTSSARPRAASASTRTGTRSAEPVVLVVQDEVKREHGIKGSLDAKVKGTSLPAIEVSLSWNNASTVTTTSKTRLVPGRYPQLPDQDPTPAVPYPPSSVVPAASVASVVPIDVGTGQTPLSSGQTPPSSALTITGSSATPTARTAVAASVTSLLPVDVTTGRTPVRPTASRRSSLPRPDSGLGTSDSEPTAYLSCVETSSDSSDSESSDSDSDNQMSPSAPLDDEEASDHEPGTGEGQRRQDGELGQVGQEGVAAQLPASAQPDASGPHLPVGHLAATPGSSTGAGPQPRSSRGRNRSGNPRPRRQRRRKREWEQSEEELSPVDEDAAFPTRISPRNKKPYQGYTKF